MSPARTGSRAAPAALPALALRHQAGQIGARHVLGHDERRGWIRGQVDDLAKSRPMKIAQLPAGGQKALGDLGVAPRLDAIRAQKLEREQLARQVLQGFVPHIRCKMGQVGFRHAARAKETLDDIVP
jgi:hypothetical protein